MSTSPGMGRVLSLKIDHRGSNRTFAKRLVSTVLELDDGDLLHGKVLDVSNRGLGLLLELPPQRPIILNR